MSPRRRSAASAALAQLAKIRSKPHSGPSRRRPLSSPATPAQTRIPPRRRGHPRTRPPPCVSTRRTRSPPRRAPRWTWPVAKRAGARTGPDRVEPSSEDAIVGKRVKPRVCIGWAHRVVVRWMNRRESARVPLKRPYEMPEPSSQTAGRTRSAGSLSPKRVRLRSRSTDERLAPVAASCAAAERSRDDASANRSRLRQSVQSERRVAISASLAASAASAAGPTDLAIPAPRRPARAAASANDAG